MNKLVVYSGAARAVENTFVKKVIVNFNTTQRLEMVEENYENLSINRQY